MLSLIKRYTRWLHTGWPAGGVEALPLVDEHGATRIDGVTIVGDLTGVPLFKLSISSGVQAVHALKDHCAARGQDARTAGKDPVDVCIVGGGIAGMSAAMECDRLGLGYVVLEANQTFATVANFPKRKPIYAYPSDMTPPGELQIRQDHKEELLDDLRAQVEERGIAVTRSNVTHVTDAGDCIAVHREDEEPLYAKTAIIAIGRSGKHRRLDVSGEDSDQVINNLHDPQEYTGQRVLVVGGGDSALETAIAIAEANGQTDAPLVTLSYRRAEFSRPKPENIATIERLADAGRVELALATEVVEIRPDAAVLVDAQGEQRTAPCEQVFTMIGREPPLEFFRRSGLPIRGEFGWRSWVLLALFAGFIGLIYFLKAFGVYPLEAMHPRTWFGWFADLADDRSSLLGTIAWSATKGIRFWITLLYSACVVGFGLDRIRRRKTPYVTWQTWTLILIQVLPLFLLPEIILPWLDANGWLPGVIKQNLFTGYYHAGGELQAYTAYWHAYGLILAWPLLVAIQFSAVPLTWWIVIGILQTFVIIPLLIWRWGKGAYCGWICSCGALAETMGDRHRDKMPHGAVWNRLNMTGQVLLAIAFIAMGLRVISWIWPGTVIGEAFNAINQLFWGPVVDYLLAAVLGISLYFWFSGRVWCRFACPLAALMHIYARFSRFRILADKKRCISCNQCTTVCHQGIDIMNFANKGRHMRDPECVRCSACVAACPTGVLQFGRVDRDGNPAARDRLGASPVLMHERAQGADDPGVAADGDQSPAKGQP